MLDAGFEQPFDSIESAIEFMNVLAETVLDAKLDLYRDRQLAVGKRQQRRAQALELAQFKLKLLSSYTFKTRRALNDLRTIRRLLLDDRLPIARVPTADLA